MKCVRLCFNKENLICLLSLHLNVALRGTFLSPQKYGICCTHSPPFGGNTALKLLFMERTVTCVSQIPSRLCVSVYQDYNSHHCVMLHLPHVGLSQIFDDWLADWLLDWYREKKSCKDLTICWGNLIIVQLTLELTLLHFSVFMLYNLDE